MPGAVEQAIIELVVNGAGAFATTNDKVQADLTSTERAGKRAEDGAAAAERSARNAEQAAKQLSAQVTQIIAKGAAFVGFAQRAAGILGVDRDSSAGQALDAAQGALSQGAQGAAIGSFLGGPVGTAVGGSLGALVGLVQSLQESEKRISAAAKKIDDQKTDDITDALLREAGLGKLDNAITRGGRQVQ